ncbi:MAG: hypothetical protein GY793_01220 [Proteobacteria bacterium]|nr:hypothetical protein [Pseudomonadota bacterium]
MMKVIFTYSEELEKRSLFLADKRTGINRINGKIYNWCRTFLEDGEEYKKIYKDEIVIYEAKNLPLNKFNLKMYNRRSADISSLENKQTYEPIRS